MTRVSRRAEDFCRRRIEARRGPDFWLPASAVCFPTLRLGVSVADLTSDFLAMRRVCAGNGAASIPRCFGSSPRPSSFGETRENYFAGRFPGAGPCRRAMSQRRANCHFALCGLEFVPFGSAKSAGETGMFRREAVISSRFLTVSRRVTVISRRGLTNTRRFLTVNRRV